MATTLKALVDKVYHDLEDDDQSVWTERADLEGYARTGYDKLCALTGAIWDMVYAENLPYCGDHTGTFEEPLMQIYQGVFNFTGGEWERDYFDNGIGPANFTTIWEMDDGTATVGTFWNSLSTPWAVGQDFILATSKLPTSLIAIDRAVHDSYRILPTPLQRIKRFDGRYQYTQGPTRNYVFENDGFFTMRKVPVPAGRANYYYYSNSLARGLLRKSTNEFGTNQTVIGSRGVLRAANQHFCAGVGRRGTPRRVFSDVKNVKVEIIRYGQDLKTYEFELPDRYARYVEHYVRHKCLQKEGVGQDLKLSDHYRNRFDQGVMRLQDRIRRTLRSRTGHFGTGGITQSKPPLVKFPWNFPAVRW
jgi:hypothetical protein